MARYAFLTTWLLDADRERVFGVVRDFEGWPGWWQGVEHVTLDGNGGMEQRWRSRLPYAVSFRAHVERIEAPALIEGRVEDGALRGRGRCRLLELTEGGTAVVFELEVETTERWMNLLAPAARRIFVWNHDVLMRRGGEGIARQLGARLLAQG
ncbi:MAG: SRPBCC family protein [Thermoleophilaceae bacterium]